MLYGDTNWTVNLLTLRFSIS